MRRGGGEGEEMGRRKRGVGGEKGGGGKGRRVGGN